MATEQARPLRAWAVGDDWMQVVYATTRGQARVAGMRAFDSDFTGLFCRRAPLFDDLAANRNEWDVEWDTARYIERGYSVHCPGCDRLVYPGDPYVVITGDAYCEQCGAKGDGRSEA